MQINVRKVLEAIDFFGENTSSAFETEIVFFQKIILKMLPN